MAYNYQTPVIRSRVPAPAAGLLWLIFTGTVAAQSASYTGPGSCSSTSCHGAIQPRSETSVLQNEYSTWVVRDKHAQAASVLTGELGTRIGRILGIKPDASAKCLDCHALNVPEQDRARSFDTNNDGVSCESCHGPASAWLGPHTTRGWEYQKSIPLGMYDTRDLVKRSELCLSCHLGDSKKWVDHEMIAAGHPDLFFELDSFEAVEPRHWKEPDKDPWASVRLLITGQAVQLRENLQRIARTANRFWPEYSELDCFACHHSLTSAKTSWRQERGYEGRRAGNPAWNSSRYAVLRVLVDQMDRAQARRLDEKLAAVSALVSDIAADRGRIAQSSIAAAEIADQIAHQLAQQKFDAPTVLQLMKRITADADAISAQGERAAEMAVMALDSLYIAYRPKETPDSIRALFQLLEDPSGYNPRVFAGKLHEIELR